jgi:hypothetical protein
MFTIIYSKSYPNNPACTVSTSAESILLVKASEFPIPNSQFFYNKLLTVKKCSGQQACPQKDVQKW